MMVCLLKKNQEQYILYTFKSTPVDVCGPSLCCLYFYKLSLPCVQTLTSWWCLCWRTDRRRKVAKRAPARLWWSKTLRGQKWHHPEQYGLQRAVAGTIVTPTGQKSHIILSWLNKSKLLCYYILVLSLFSVNSIDCIIVLPDCSNTVKSAVGLNGVQIIAFLKLYIYNIYRTYYQKHHRQCGIQIIEYQKMCF